MNKQTKEKLLRYCIDKQQKVIDALQMEIDDAQRQSNEYGAPKDRYDPFKTKMMRQRDMFAQQLSKSNQVMNTLQQVPIEKDFNKVAFGALVILEKQNLFVAAGLGKIELDGITYYAISPAVPIFKAMAGKEAGETFQFNGNNFVIKQIV